MESNPIVEIQQKEEAIRKANAAFRYPYKVTCVFLDWENNDFPIIHDVRKHCNDNNIVFSARQYDIDRFQDDVDVRRLPAFHVHYKGSLYDTLYYDLDPVYKLNLIIWAYQDEEMAKEQAKLRREEQWKGFLELFSLERFKKKGKLDLERSLRHQNGLKPDDKNKTKNDNN